jgi:hypothetical protein
MITFGIQERICTSLLTLVASTSEEEREEKWEERISFFW